MHALSRITVYEETPDMTMLNSLIDVALNNIDDMRGVGDALEKLKQCIRNEITEAKARYMEAPEYGIEGFAEGSTSYCYRTTRDDGEKYIYKVFYPTFFDGAKKYLVCEENGFRWISDTASDDQKRSFLKRYVRFIKQNEVITKVNSSIHKNKENIAMLQPVLTSLGFAFRILNRYGATFEEYILQNGIGDSDDDAIIIEKIKCCVEIVRKAAEYIEKYCHRDCDGYYHGDIKPDNLLIPNNSTLVENIDFDTWMNQELIDRNLQTIYDATTPMFYEDVEACVKIADWQVYDVRALSKTLMYSLMGKNRNKLNSYMDEVRRNNSKFDWIDFFFSIKSGCGEKILRVMNKSNKQKYLLSALFVFNKLRSVIVRSCSTGIPFNNRIIKIKDFIAELKDLENLMGALISGNPPAILSESAIRYLGLKRLDEERGDKPLRHAEYKELIAQGLSCDWARFVIEQNYYCTKENEAERNADTMVVYIDRHLIPDVLLEGSDETPLSYDFENNKSPLEQALEKAGNKSLFLTAEGGQGKTTMLRSFWLDFLSGKHDKPCLYVDVKLLNQQNGHEAIDQYIYNTYRVKLSEIKCSNKPILLLDGANESDDRLRDRGGSDVCPLVSECRGLIEQDRARIIIGTRSKEITTLGVEEAKKGNRAENYEFGDAVRYATVCKLNDTQIKYCLGRAFADVADKQPLIDLLRNNMMLRIYMELKASRVQKLDEDNMKAGRLLDTYFNRCFKARYFKHICELDINEKEICELIDKVSDENTYEKNALYEKDIHDRLADYKNTIDYLINNSFKMYFAVDDFAGGDIYCHLLCELSLLKKIDSEMYTWANELYQEYFRASNIRDIVSKLYENTEYLIKFVCWYDEKERIWVNNYLDWQAKIICDDSRTKADIRNYNAIQYAGEILGYDKDQFALIKRKLAEAIHMNPGIPYYNYIDETELITIMCALSCKELPSEINILGCGVFYNCLSLTSIEIPNSVKYISNQAFMNCKNLNSVKMGSDIIEICQSAFEGCVGLKTIVIPRSVKRICSDAFFDCHKLKQLYLYKEMTGTRCSFGGMDREIQRQALYDRTGYYDNESLGIDENAFYGCSALEKIDVEDGNPHYHSRNNCIIETKSKKLVLGCKRSVVPNDGSVETIASRAFAGNSKLHFIIIPDKVVNIESNAFVNSGLKCVKILGMHTQINEYSFYGCKLKTIFMPKSLYESLCENGKVEWLENAEINFI